MFVPNPGRPRNRSGGRGGWETTRAGVDGGAWRASAYLLRGGAAAARVEFIRHVRPRRSTDDAGAYARARLFGPFPSSDLVPKVNNWFLLTFQRVHRDRATRAEGFNGTAP